MFFFFNDTATTDIYTYCYTLSLHDALPIYLATDLGHGAIPRERFHEHDAAAPLPRAYQWADGSAYVNHVALVRQARGAAMPDSFWPDSLMFQGGSDGFLGLRDAIPLKDADWGCDLEERKSTLLNSSH